MNPLLTLLHKIDISAPSWAKPLIVTLGIESLYSTIIADSSHWITKIFWMSISYITLHFLGRYLNKKYPKHPNNEKNK